MKQSRMAQAVPKSGLVESHAMLATNEFSPVNSKSQSSAKDEGRSGKYSHHQNCITPKTRVVYVYEPKIIKTDPENFRSLVQRLTGKSSRKSKEKKSQTNPKSSSSEVIATEVGTTNLDYTFYTNDHLPILENKTTKFSAEDCSGFSIGFSVTGVISPPLTNEGLQFSSL